MANIKVDYLGHMGDDLTVVNAARVSFDKESDGADWYDVDMGNHFFPLPVLNDRDSKLSTTIGVLSVIASYNLGSKHLSLLPVS
jgi:hypothetical protein